MRFENLFIILKNLRFPENAGMAARACANMGANNLCLVSPQNWDPLKASPTATSCGRKVLNRIKIYANLEEVIKNCHIAYATSARTGGWRSNLYSPQQAANEIIQKLLAGNKVAILFGPEDSGLSNRDISLCNGIIKIDTAENACSLNISQAILLILYELRKQSCHNSTPIRQSSKNSLTLQEIYLLEEKLKECLVLLGCISGKNTDYHFRQWHDILGRAELKRHEYDALSGLCRQIGNLFKKYPFLSTQFTSKNDDLQGDR